VSIDLLLQRLALQHHLSANCATATGEILGLFVNYLLGRHGLLAGLAELLNCLLVVAKILLAANQEYRDITAEVEDLSVPLLR